MHWLGLFRGDFRNYLAIVETQRNGLIRVVASRGVSLE